MITFELDHCTDHYAQYNLDVLVSLDIYAMEHLLNIHEVEIVNQVTDSLTGSYTQSIVVKRYDSSNIWPETLSIPSGV